MSVCSNVLSGMYNYSLWTDVIALQGHTHTQTFVRYTTSVTIDKVK